MYFCRCILKSCNHKRDIYVRTHTHTGIYVHSNNRPALSESYWNRLQRTRSAAVRVFARNGRRRDGCVFERFCMLTFDGIQSKTFSLFFLPRRNNTQQQQQQQRLLPLILKLYIYKEDGFSKEICCIYTCV